MWPSGTCRAIMALMVVILAACTPATPTAPSPDGRAQTVSAPESDAEARVRTLEAENSSLKQQLADLQGELEHLQEWADQADAERMAADALWLTVVDRQKPAREDFAPLAQARGVLLDDANPQPLEMGPEKAALAADVLSGAIPLGAAEPPPEEKRDYSLEFLGLSAPETVILAGPAAYYRGKVYYRPMLSVGLGNSLNACCG